MGAAAVAQCGRHLAHWLVLPVFVQTLLVIVPPAGSHRWFVQYWRLICGPRTVRYVGATRANATIL